MAVLGWLYDGHERWSGLPQQLICGGLDAQAAPQADSQKDSTPACLVRHTITLMDEKEEKEKIKEKEKEEEEKKETHMQITRRRMVTSNF